MRRPLSETETPMFRLFVYGTLKRGYWNHGRFCRDAISIEEATVRGRLYELPSGIPMIKVPDEDVMALGSGDPVADAKSQASTTTPGRGVCVAGWGSVRGEIITFTNSATCIPRIDRLEGFTPAGPSMYVRVLIPARDPMGTLVPVWCYVAPDYMLGDAVRMPGDSWP